VHVQRQADRRLHPISTPQVLAHRAPGRSRPGLCPDRAPLPPITRPWVCSRLATCLPIFQYQGWRQRSGGAGSGASAPVKLCHQEMSTREAERAHLPGLKTSLLVLPTHNGSCSAV
jgi:hypothetical protein